MIPELQLREDIALSEKLSREFDRMQHLIDSLNSKAIPEGIAVSITQQLEMLNS
ncbi:hypothetical protein [Pontibacter virosus]|uniref:Uncharacterized protein n=1 Tax=Pontibacter virosus TaxID=1765052 RepID=A0A2U1AP86_9BACT|nr:hypothetical protein [Pontibacter virosus]PVY38216.1 hypothetical protein C8E01_11864 [Pontibacter virosus]